MVGTTGRFTCAGTSARAYPPTQVICVSTPLFFRILTFTLVLAILVPAGNRPVAAQSVDDCFARVDIPTPVTSVHVQPGAGYAPVLDEINNARCSIDISMYLFTSAEILAGLQYAEQRGIRVRVILEQVPFGTFGSQQEMFDELTAIGAEVKWSPPQFTFLHAKYMIVDNSALVVTNQNFTGAGFNSNREFGVVTTEAGYVDEAVQIFTSDWEGFDAPTGFQHLVVSPVNARQSILNLINSSRGSVWMYAEVLRDEEVTQALDDAVARGVDVRLLVNPSASDDDAPYFLDALDHGVQIRVLDKPYVHSKALIVDGTHVLIGSQNYSFTSLDRNREVGIVLSDAVSLDIVGSTFLSDWSRAAPVDTITAIEPDHHFRLTPDGWVGKLTCGRWGVV